MTGVTIRRPQEGDVSVLAGGDAEAGARVEMSDGRRREGGEAVAGRGDEQVPGPADLGLPQDVMADAVALELRVRPWVCRTVLTA